MDIEILEIKDLLSQQTQQFSAELEAIKWRLPEPEPRWWEMASGIIAAMLLVVLSFSSGVLFHCYLFNIPCN